MISFVLDHSEFAAHYAEVAPAIYVWASVRTRPLVRGFCELEDLLQEVWCRAYAIRDRFDPARTTFRAWVFRVAKNVLLEVVRKARLAGRVATAQGQTTRILALSNVPDEATSVSRRVARDEALRAFLTKVEALENQERELFVHVGLEGLDYGEAAELLGISRDAAKKRWQRLRARLVKEGLPATLVG